MPKTIERKRDEALDRKIERESRSVADQLRLLKKRPGAAKRERARLAQMGDK